MSATALTNIQEIIERSIFEVIRLELVDKGYLPDISDTGTYPDTNPGHAQWETDINAIVVAKGFAIELFGAGNNQAKGTKKVPRIVIESGNFLPGALGGDPRRYFSDQGADYQALVTPPQTVDFYLNFCLVSGTAAQNRVLNALMALTIKRRGYIPWYSDGTKTFFARYLNYYDRNEEDKGIIEHVYAYEIPDAWDHEDIEVYDSIAKLNELTFNINIQKYEDGSWGHDATTMVVTP
jgi:hypothetical protein